MFVLPTKQRHLSSVPPECCFASGCHRGRRNPAKPPWSIVYSGNCFDASYANFCIRARLWKGGLSCILVMAGSRVMGHNMLTSHHPQWPFHIWSVASPTGGQLEGVGGGETKQKDALSNSTMVCRRACCIQNYLGHVTNCWVYEFSLKGGFCCKLIFNIKKFSLYWGKTLVSIAIIYKYVCQTWIHSFLLLIL